MARFMNIPVRYIEMLITPGPDADHTQRTKECIGQGMGFPGAGEANRRGCRRESCGRVGGYSSADWIQRGLPGNVAVPTSRLDEL